MQVLLMSRWDDWLLWSYMNKVMLLNKHRLITMVNSRRCISDGMLYMLVLHIYLADYALIYREMMMIMMMMINQDDKWVILYYKFPLFYDIHDHSYECSMWRDDDVWLNRLISWSYGTIYIHNHSYEIFMWWLTYNDTCNWEW